MPAAEAAEQSPLVDAAARRTGAPPADTAVAVGTALGQAHEQEWIVADVLTAVTRLTAEGGVPLGPLRVETEPGGWAHIVRVGESPAVRLPIVTHVWSPETYVALARQRLGRHAGSGGPGDDLNVRAALTDLRVDVLLDQDALVGERLAVNRWSPAAHDAAALLLGAFALRETLNRFGDSRPELSRMTAHLTVADALRGSAPMSRDGLFARAIHASLAGLQREALRLVTTAESAEASAADRAWIRALRLRITGDWRQPLSPRLATRLEQYEYGRALEARRGSDALLAWLETFEQDEATDWRRIGFQNDWTVRFTLEASAVFAADRLAREMAEAGSVWSRLHDGRPIGDGALIVALNDRPSATTATAPGGAALVLDWPRWAAAAQRHIATALWAEAKLHRMRGDPESGRALVRDTIARFSSLTLFPVALRSIAVDAPEYARSMREARQLAATHPEVITASAWNLLSEPPRFQTAPERFPLFQSWYYPIAPTGTAFDLYPRALQEGCPRPPPPEQAAVWAAAQPYDTWTVLSAEWFPVEGRPKAADVVDALGPLLAYDAQANEHMILELDMPVDDRLRFTRTLCQLSGECGRYAWVLLAEGRDEEARVAFEDWIARSRDHLGPANESGWLARHYVRTGRPADAMRIARYAAETYSQRGLEVLAEVLTSLGRDDEALDIGERIAARYDDRTPRGTHRLRVALRTKDRQLELAAMADLQPVFPNGVERLAMHALDPTPKDGVTFGPLSTRARAIGIRQDDIVVGVDEWRVRTQPQYSIALALRPTEDAVTLTVFRDGRYRQLALRMPERRLVVAIENVARQR
jgi:tetratricopeptide (TPR) repeat protein